MAIRTYKVTLDSKNAIAPEPVYLRQGDKTGAVVIDATLMDNGAPFSLDGLTPMFKANTADGQAVIADSTGFNIVNASGGEFTYQVPSQLGSVSGKIQIAYFSFSDSSGAQSTFNVVFIVEKSADMTKESAKDWVSTLSEIIEQYNQWANDAHNSWEQFVNDNKEIIESIDPGGKVISELTDFRHSDMLSKTFDTAKLRGDFWDEEFRDRGVNVKWYGAVGDGITDNNIAIKTAIQVAQSTGVNRVYIPEGIFYTSGVNNLVKNMQIVGAGAWASIIATDKADPIFNLNNNSLIENIGIKQNSEIEAIGLGVEPTEDPSSYWNVRIRHVHIFGPEVPSTGKGTWKLTGIKFDLNGKGLWDVTLDDVNIEWVYDGVIADTYNQGWFTGSLYNNVTVKGFANCAFGSISSNNTMRQISQNNFTNLTAEILYDTPDAVGFVVSGVGNEYDNLRLFADGAYSGHAIQLRYYGDADHDAQNPSFGGSANNSFIGGTIEGDIDDPDGIRSLQHFDHLKLQIKDDKGVLQQVFVEDEPMPNLLGRETLSRMLDYRNQQVLVTKSSTVASGADQYGKYIEITTAAAPAYWSYLLTEPDETAGALVGHDFSVGVRFRAMTDGSEITSGAIRLNEAAYNGKLLYTYRNPASSGDLKDYVWIYSSQDSYFNLGKSSRFDCVAFYIPANMSVRIYDAFLVSGRVTSFERVEQRDNFNNPKIAGGRNLVEASNDSNDMLASDTAVTNQATQTKVYQVDRDALNWMIGENVVVSVDVNIHDYVNTNVSGRLAAYAELQLTFEDGSTFFASAGITNFSATLIRGRYSCYYRIPNKTITKAVCAVTTPSGFTASYFQIGRPMVESGTVAHDFVPYIADA